METFHTALIPELPRLRALARRFSREPDDLVQETMARALRYQEQFRVGSNLRAWLTTILYHQHASERRRGFRYARARAVFAAEPRGRALDPSLSAELAEVCPRLPSADLALIARAELDGASYAELALELAVPIGTVMSRLFRARRRIASLVAPRVPGAMRTPPEARASSRTLSRGPARRPDSPPRARSQARKPAEPATDLVVAPVLSATTQSGAR